MFLSNQTFVFADTWTSQGRYTFVAASIGGFCSGLKTMRSRNVFVFKTERKPGLLAQACIPSTGKLGQSIKNLRPARDVKYNLVSRGGKIKEEKSKNK